MSRGPSHGWLLGETLIIVERVVKLSSGAIALSLFTLGCRAARRSLCRARRLSISRVIPNALRVGRAPILLTRPLWTSWVKDRSCRLTVGFDSPDVNLFCSARHEQNCYSVVAVDPLNLIWACPPVIQFNILNFSL